MKIPQPHRLTRSQQNALHLWYKLKSKQCQEAGVTAQMAFNKTIEIEMTPQIMKEIFREVMKIARHKSSTTELDKATGEIDDIVEHVNRFFAEPPFFLEGLPLPNDPTKDLAPLLTEKNENL